MGGEPEIHCQSPLLKSLAKEVYCVFPGENCRSLRDFYVAGSPAGSAAGRDPSFPNTGGCYHHHVGIIQEQSVSPVGPERTS